MHTTIKEKETAGPNCCYNICNDNVLPDRNLGVKRVPKGCFVYFMLEIRSCCFRDITCQAAEEVILAIHLSGEVEFAKDRTSFCIPPLKILPR